MKEQKKNKGSVLVAESAYNAQNAQFGLVMKKTQFFVSPLNAQWRMLGRGATEGASFTGRNAEIFSINEIATQKTE